MATKLNRVLFVGSNPSNASPNNSAFDPATKSTKILQGWVETLGDIETRFANVSDVKTSGNRPLSSKEIREALPGLEAKIKEIAPDKIIALGCIPSRILTLLHREFFALPHPSPKNRVLNDRIKVQELIKEAYLFVHSNDSL